MTTRPLCPSGEVIIATYEIRGDRLLAEQVAQETCIEQTVEFPADLITSREIRNEIFGRVSALFESGENRWTARLEYSAEVAASEVTQTLNLVFGNTSLKPGVRLVDLDFPPSLLSAFGGPRFGVAGLRQRLGVSPRPLVASAIKPMGLPVDTLAQLAFEMALGGVDIIKDDHGLSNQPFGPYGARVEAVCQAVRRAVESAGKPCLYAPNVSAPMLEILPRAQLAAEQGAGALLIAPGLCGFDALRLLASPKGPGLPVLCHPALLGSFTASADSGLSHGLAHGLLPRVFGADASIFPNHGGRFSFSEASCREIARACLDIPPHLPPCFPVPAGGMTLERAGEIVSFYGNDTILLIGGDLRRHGELSEGCRRFVRQAQEGI